MRAICRELQRSDSEMWICVCARSRVLGDTSLVPPGLRLWGRRNEKAFCHFRGVSFGRNQFLPPGRERRARVGWEVLLPFKQQNPAGPGHLWLLGTEGGGTGRWALVLRPYPWGSLRMGSFSVAFCAGSTRVRVQVSIPLVNCSWREHCFALCLPRTELPL